MGCKSGWTSDSDRTGMNEGIKGRSLWGMRLNRMRTPMQGNKERLRDWGFWAGGLDGYEERPWDQGSRLDGRTGLKKDWEIEASESEDRTSIKEDREIQASGWMAGRVCRQKGRSRLSARGLGKSEERVKDQVFRTRWPDESGTRLSVWGFRPVAGGEADLRGFDLRGQES